MADEKVTRRGFAGWMGKALFAGLLGGAMLAPAQILRDRDDRLGQRRRAPGAREYEGFSDRNDFNGALRDAIKKAERDWAGDRYDSVRWELSETTGVIGGRAGRGQVTVRIRVLG